jgi:hypothetical protein
MISVENDLIVALANRITAKLALADLSRFWRL